MGVSETDHSHPEWTELPREDYTDTAWSAHSGVHKVKVRVSGSGEPDCCAYPDNERPMAPGQQTATGGGPAGESRKVRPEFKEEMAG